LPVLSFAGPGGQVEIHVEAPRVPDPEELPADPPLDDDVPPAEPADATPSEHDAETPDPPVEETNSVSLVWGTLTALSVGLAVVVLVITALALSRL
jgi:hypothetical protein